MPFISAAVSPNTARPPYRAQPPDARCPPCPCGRGRRGRGARGGQVLVAGIGLAAGAVSAGVGVYGLRRTFATYLRTAQMSAPARKVV